MKLLYSYRLSIYLSIYLHDCFISSCWSLTFKCILKTLQLYYHSLTITLFDIIFYINLFSFLFFFIVFFEHLYWSIIALQCCVSFRFITKWISYTYTYVPISLPSCISLPPTLLIPPLQVVTKHWADLPVLCNCFPLAICFMFGSVYMSMPLSHFVPAYPSPSLYPQVHSLVGLCFYTCLTPRFFMTIYFLDSIYMC